MAGHSQINWAIIVKKYSKWVAQNVVPGTGNSFIDTHVDEMGEVLASQQTLTLAEIVTFLNDIKAKSKTTKEQALILCFLLERTDISGKWTELELIADGGATKLASVDVFTPPSLYMLDRPLDLVLYNYQSIKKIAEMNSVAVFEKTSSSSDGEEVTLNFLISG